MVTFSRDTTGAEVVETFREHITGKHIVITGTSAGGLGSQTALDIAKAKPATLILLSRNASKVQPLINQIASISPSTKAVFVAISLDDLDSVRHAADEVSKYLPDGKVDVLINNAGIMAVPYSTTRIGVELQFAVNHVGHFLFTLKLSPFIKAAGKSARVVNLSSNGYLFCPFRANNVNFDDGKSYDPLSGYGQSKTANLLFSRGLAKRGIVSFAVHPGFIPHTHLGDGVDLSLFQKMDEITIKNTGKAFGALDQPKTLEQGTATTLIAAFDPAIVGENGGYLKDSHIVDVADFAKDGQVVEELWKLSEKLVGETFEI